MNSSMGLVIAPSIVSDELVPEVFSYYLKQGMAGCTKLIGKIFGVFLF